MIDPATLRDLIRDVIAEEVKAIKNGRKPVTPASPATHAVRIAGDSDLAAFAKQVLTLAEAPAVKAAILDGRHPFKLAAGNAAQVERGASQAGRSHRLDKGVVTESVILTLPAGVNRLVLGPEVSITPLAKDKAKSRNISIERARR